MDEAVPLSIRITQADRTGLLALVKERLSSFTERDALRVLRHPHAGAAVIEEILAVRALLAVRAVRKALALHPATPRPDALHCLEDLPWRDLLEVGREVRTPPPVRIAANRRLLEALRYLSKGEKIAAARLVDRDLFQTLLDEKDPAITEALLKNSRLTAEDLLRWITVGAPDGSRLTVVASDTRWACRPDVREAILKHRLTPRAVALTLLRSGTPAEWKDLVEDPTLDPLLSACAARLLRERPRRTGAGRIVVDT